jgi:hypothetical protein
MRSLPILAFALAATLAGAEPVAPVEPETKAAATVAAGADEASATALIAQQKQLIHEGKVEELRAGFTERLRARITPEAVARGLKETDASTLAQLAAKVEIAVVGDLTVAKIRMENGRKLTTLVWTDGRWLADTIWFN